MEIDTPAPDQMKLIGTMGSETLIENAELISILNVVELAPTQDRN